MKNLTLKELSKKRLDNTYLTIFLLKNEIHVKRNEIIEPDNIYTLIGIDTLGNSNILNILQEKNNRSRFWLDCFEHLKNRGVNNILFLSLEEDKNIKKAAKLAFPNIIFTDSITAIVPKFYKYCTNRSSKHVGGRLTTLYTQMTLSDYEVAFKSFIDEYNNPIHKKLIDTYLKNIKTSYKYSINIRKLLFIHRKYTSFHDIIRLNFKDKYISSFEELVLEIDSLINKFSSLSSFTKNQWMSILNDLSIIYPDIELIN